MEVAMRAGSRINLAKVNGGNKIVNKSVKVYRVRCRGTHTVVVGN